MRILPRWGEDHTKVDRGFMPEAWQRVAGGCNEVETTGSGRRAIGTPAGVPAMIDA
ncbi:MAG: hypothetical protein WCJ97_10345 [Phycisphaerae bacterium]